MTTLKDAALTIVKIIIGGIVAVIVLSIWYDQQQQQESRDVMHAEIHAAATHHWQIVTSTKGDEPAAWAIDSDDGTVMYCRFDETGSAPICSKADN